MPRCSCDCDMRQISEKEDYENVIQGTLISYKGKNYSGG